MKNEKDALSKDSLNFLETINAIGYDVLIPIYRIERIMINYGSNGWEIHIKTIDDDVWSEYFEKDEEKLNKRWDQIKQIVSAK